MPQEQRRQTIEKYISEAYVLIGEYEGQQLYSSDPKEKGRIRREIEDTRKNISEWQAELDGLSSTHNASEIASAHLLVCPTPPQAPVQFGGRDGPLADLKNRLKSGQTTAITAVQGLGGIGKTTLAKKLANDLFYNESEKTFRAVLWADITREPNPQVLLTDWARYAEPDFSPGSTALPQLARHVKALLEKLIRQECETCQPNRTLVILDDAWDNGYDTVNLLREASPAEATILITTRSEELASRIGARKLELKQLSKAEGVAFLSEYLPQADPAQLEKLSELLGGHALALKLAAHLVLKKSEARQTQALNDLLALYEKGRAAGANFAGLKLAEGEKPEENLELALSYSYAELNDKDKNRFRALGTLAFDAPFNTPMLSALWRIEDEEVEETCDRFRRLSLLEELVFDQINNNQSPAPQSSFIAYRQHALLRTYARGLAAQAGELNEDCQLNARYYADFLQGLSNKWAIYYKEIDHHWLNIVETLEWCYRTNDPLLAGLVDWLRNYFLNRNLYDLHRRYLPAALMAARTADNNQLQANLLMAWGRMESRLGNLDQAHTHYDNALLLFKLAQSSVGQANILKNLGDLALKINRFDLARIHYDEALSLYQLIEDRHGQANILQSLGNLAGYTGNFDQARAHYDEALPLFKLEQDYLGQAGIYQSLGEIYLESNENELAQMNFEQALPLYIAEQSSLGLANVLVGLGPVRFKQGAREQGIADLKKAVELYQKVQYKEWEQIAKDRLAELEQKLKEES